MKLFENLLKHSQSEYIEVAKKEWRLSSIFYDEQYQRCLCGHYPIKEICVIENKFTEDTLHIGNCCIDKIIFEKSDIKKLDNEFSAAKRVKKNILKSFHKDTIHRAFCDKVINTWERSFYLDIIRKINLSEKQEKYKVKINIKILLSFFPEKQSQSTLF